MPFVIIGHRSIGQHPDQPIEKMTVFFNDAASGEYDLIFDRQIFHPLKGGPIHFSASFAASILNPVENISGRITS